MYQTDLDDHYAPICDRCHDKGWYWIAVWGETLNDPCTKKEQICTCRAGRDYKATRK